MCVYTCAHVCVYLHSSRKEGKSTTKRNMKLCTLETKILQQKRKKNFYNFSFPEVIQNQNTWSDQFVGKISWRKEWQPTPAFLLGKAHGQSSLAGYSSWSRNELDRTEWLTMQHNLGYPAPSSVITEKLTSVIMIISLFLNIVSSS